MTITQPNTRVDLINGATACNVFCQVTSYTTLGVNSTFRGTILTLTNSTLNTGATLEGSVFSRNGAVTLDQNTILRPDCASAVTATTAAGAAARGGRGRGTRAAPAAPVARSPGCRSARSTPAGAQRPSPPGSGRPRHADDQPFGTC